MADEPHLQIRSRGVFNLRGVSGATSAARAPHRWFRLPTRTQRAQRFPQRVNIVVEAIKRVKIAFAKATSHLRLLAFTLHITIKALE